MKSVARPFEQAGIVHRLWNLIPPLAIAPMLGIAAGVAPPYPNSCHWSMPISSMTISRMFGVWLLAALTGS